MCIRDRKDSEDEVDLDQEGGSFWLSPWTRGVSAWFVLMADVKDANATPATVSVSLHDTPDGDDLASAQLDSAGAEEGKSRSGDSALRFHGMRYPLVLENSTLGLYV